MRNIAHWIVRGLPAVDVAIQVVLLALLVSDRRAIPQAELLLLLVAVPLTSHFLRGVGVYDSHRMGGRRDVIRKLAGAQFMAAGVFAVFLTISGSYGSIGLFAAFFVVSGVVFVIERWFVYFFLQRLRRSGFDRKNVCVVGTVDAAGRLDREFLQHPEWGLSVVCRSSRQGNSHEFFQFPSGESVGTDVEEVLKTLVIDEILIAVPPEEVHAEAPLVRACEQFGLVGRVLLPGLAGGAAVEDFHGKVSIAVAPARCSESDLALKRVFDATVATGCLLLATPILLAAAAAVKLSSRGPVFFIQTRVGLNGRKFRMYKFRTMVNGADTMIRHSNRSITRGPVFKDARDYRITEVGRFLRRFSIDELPQLFNVFQGDMSMVGPRPLPVYEADQITGDSRRRFSMPPGITCIWQVNGRSDVGFERWMQYDLQYVDRWSFWADAVLLFRTIPAILSGRGAY